jgi:hypothetical protein
VSPFAQYAAGATHCNDAFSSFPTAGSPKLPRVRTALENFPAKIDADVYSISARIQPEYSLDEGGISSEVSSIAEPLG